jgi:hypothetical protein
MPLTSAQKAIVKADILAQPDLSAIQQGSDGSFIIADLYNLNASPDFWVWKSKLSRGEVVNDVGPEGTSFAWTGSGYITRSQGERDAFREIFNHTGTCNPSLVNVRNAFNDIFSGGTAPAPANRAHIAAVSRRKASRLEKLLATGTGSTASPAVLTFEGLVSWQDIDDVRG